MGGLQEAGETVGETTDFAGFLPACIWKSSPVTSQLRTVYRSYWAWKGG